MAHQAHLAYPDLLDQKENLEIQETQEIQEDLDLKDPPALMELLVALDQPGNEVPMERQALQVAPVSLEPREKQDSMVHLASTQPQEPLAETDSMDHLD